MHRWVWVHINGSPAPGTVIRHLCDNRLCYRLDHLMAGTVAENNADIRAAGRLGPAPKLPPSAVADISARKRGGETNACIHRDYPQVSLATIKRIR